MDKTNVQQQVSASSPDIEIPAGITLEWLRGSHRRANSKPGTMNMELWTQKEDQLYEGLAINIVGGKKEVAEVMTLDLKKQEFAVKHGTDPQVIFKLTELEENRFTCENPANEFPKKIEYRKTDKGMQATISGGGPAVEFVFEASRATTK